MKKGRLVVVDNLDNGTSKVTKDCYPAPFFLIADGHEMTELWFSEKETTRSSAPADIQKQFSNDLEPGAKRFIRSTFPPFSKVQQYAKELGFSVDKKFLMHNTTTIDFAIVHKGQIELITENGSILLNAGDCIVQKATVHSWVNPGSEPAEMFFIMLGADVPSSYRAQRIDFKVPVHIDYPSKKNMAKHRNEPDLPNINKMFWLNLMIAAGCVFYENTVDADASPVISYVLWIIKILTSLTSAAMLGQYAKQNIFGNHPHNNDHRVDRPLLTKSNTTWLKSALGSFSIFTSKSSEPPLSSPLDKTVENDRPSFNKQGY